MPQKTTAFLVGCPKKRVRSTREYSARFASAPGYPALKKLRTTGAPRAPLAHGPEHVPQEPHGPTERDQRTATLPKSPGAASSGSQDYAGKRALPKNNYVSLFCGSDYFDKKDYFSLNSSPSAVGSPANQTSKKMVPSLHDAEFTTKPECSDISTALSRAVHVRLSTQVLKTPLYVWNQTKPWGCSICL